MMHFPINLCGVEDNVENYQSYLISCCAVIVFESYELLFFRFAIRISISLMISMLIYAFIYFFTAHTSLGCRKCLKGRLFNRKPDKLLPLTQYRILDAAHVILKVYVKDAMNDALFAPLSNYSVDQRIKQKRA